MEKSHEMEYHRLEGFNWWYVSRRRIIISFMKKFADGDAKILDIGCSGGELISELKKVGYKNVYGIDKSADAVKICEQKGIKNVFIGDAGKVKFENVKFDFVIFSDVLEHFKNDAGALRLWKRALAQNGKMIIFVPAFQSLWSNHDIEAHHFRRYSKKDFFKVIDGVGLKIEEFGFWNFACTVPLYILRKIKNSKIFKMKSNDIYKLPNFLNGLLLNYMDLENFSILSGIKFPFGVSMFAVVSKKHE